MFQQIMQSRSHLAWRCKSKQHELLNRRQEVKKYDSERDVDKAINYKRLYHFLVLMNGGIVKNIFSQKKIKRKATLSQLLEPLM